MSVLPAPLVKLEVDLNGYEFMPLFGERLRRSSFNTRATDAEFRAAVNIWWSSWWETPAASLPNNERDLCRLAGLDDVRRWRKVREIVMEKWVLCSDDRWYHPLLADLACDAFAKRKSLSTKGRNGANKRWGIKAQADAPANATASPAYGSGIASPIKPDSPGNSAGNSKRSEVNNPPTPHSTARSKPPSTSRSMVEATQRHLAEMRTRGHSPPPGDVPPSQFLKAFVEPKRDPFEDDLQPLKPEPPADADPQEGAAT